LDIEKHLIFVKSEDKTEQIKDCQYVDGGWDVIYNNYSKVFSYKYQNVEWYKNPKIINPQTSVVYVLEQPLGGVLKIFDFGDYIKG